MTRWTTRHLHLSTGAVSALDRVVEHVVAPVAAETGRPWFFVRYWQGGPHVRLRVRDLDDAEAARLTARLEELLPQHAAPRPDEPLVDVSTYMAEAGRQARGETGENRRVDTLRVPGVHAAHYEPEIERYGGPAVMDASEELFTRSSELVVRLLPRLPDLGARRQVALRLTEAAARSIGPDVARAVFHEIGRRSWAAWAASYGYEPSLVARVSIVRAAPSPAAFAELSGWARGWHDDVADLVGTLTTAGVPLPGTVVSSHVHMTHNRLGLTILDELRTYAVLAATFPAPAGSVPDLGLPVPPSAVPA
ncbi:lantibiotic dehydratase C-terminal domain-containing protein [Phycicoccus jejuensis]|uniref:lantibiotic dehydratase C-terminal domain-containing protein n=1 Tax=Phycicoccus jejuensis TaxID=367299 RepID=UPI000AC340C4|nr:lantibiotic dehydratase C-terminal domain-containing protein [Phycicoccus jejuensis]